jgi:hypothetical protein
LFTPLTTKIRNHGFIKGEICFIWNKFHTSLIEFAYERSQLGKLVSWVQMCIVNNMQIRKYSFKAIMSYAALTSVLCASVLCSRNIRLSSVSNSGVPRNFLVGGCSTNSVEDRWQREWGSGGVSPLVRGPTHFANEWNPYSD